MATLEINIVGDLLDDKFRLLSWRTAFKQVPHISTFFGHLNTNPIDQKNSHEYLLDKTSVKLINNHKLDRRTMNYHFIGDSKENAQAVNTLTKERKDNIHTTDTLEETLLRFKDTPRILRCYLSPLSLPKLMTQARRMGYNVNIEVRTFTPTKPTFLKLKYSFTSLLKQEEKSWNKVTKTSSMGVQLYQFRSPRVILSSEVEKPLAKSVC